jgi:CDP-diacylglycerol--glycerol-3-phosphate 3-phosphatidyltransferase
MANLITVGRLILLFVVVALIYFGDANVVGICMFFILAVFASDGLDGYVARKTKTTSEFGAVFDIAGDRIVENVLWIIFADLDLIPIWVPLLVLTRGFIVDGLRSLSYARGMTAFGERNMMRSRFTEWLTAGRFMRALFGYAKAIAFVFLTGLYADGLPSAEGTWVQALYNVPGLTAIGWTIVWLAVALTIIRGLPVVYDAWDWIVATSDRPRSHPQPTNTTARTTGTKQS